jgi:chromosomal replication initiation ATPase DnaA
MYELVAQPEAPIFKVEAGRAMREAATHDWEADYVISLVSRHKNMSIPLLMHRSRGRAGAARARQLAMYLCHVVLGRSLKDVGDAFGRDRTTVSYACAAIEDLRDDAAIEEEICRLERTIEAGLQRLAADGRDEH